MTSPGTPLTRSAPSGPSVPAPLTALVGARVLVLRPEARARSLLTALADAGGTGQAVAVTAVRPPSDPASLDAAILALAAGDYDWVGFTSVNAVAAVVERARTASGGARDSRRHQGRRRRAGDRRGRPCAWHSGRPGAGRIRIGCRPRGGPGRPPATARSVLLPQSESADGTLADLLAAKGFDVVRVGAYRVDADSAAGERRRRPDRRRVRRGRADLAGSVVEALAGTPAGPRHGGDRPRRAHRPAARRRGLTPVVADRPTDDGLMAALGRRPGAKESPMSYPSSRPRRLRRTAALRRLVAETRLHPADLVLPMFVKEGLDAPAPIIVDARRRAAHPGLAAEGRGRGGRGRGRRPDDLRHPGGARRGRLRRRPTRTGSSTSRCPTLPPRSAATPC